jgi:tetratricopeptide (TPR) repeat protein
MGSKQKIQKLAVMLSKIAALYTTMGLPDCAIKALRNALCIVRQEHGNNNMNVAVIFNDLGIIYGSQFNTQSSLLCFEESLRIRQCLRSDTIVPVLFNIARCHAQKGDHKGALRQYEKIVVFEMQKRWDEHGPTKWSPNVVLDALDHMAMSLHSELREPRKALYCYEKGLQLMKEMDSAKIPLRFQSKFLGNAGSIQLELGNGDEALRLFSETMRVNIAAGYEFNSNINTSGLELLLLIDQLPRGAPAA